MGALFGVKDEHVFFLNKISNKSRLVLLMSCRGHWWVCLGSPTCLWCNLGPIWRLPVLCSPIWCMPIWCLMTVYMPVWCLIIGYMPVWYLSIPCLANLGLIWCKLPQKGLQQSFYLFHDSALWQNMKSGFFNSFSKFIWTHWPQLDPPATTRRAPCQVRCSRQPWGKQRSLQARRLRSRPWRGRRGRSRGRWATPTGATRQSRRLLPFHLDV